MTSTLSSVMNGITIVIHALFYLFALVLGIIGIYNVLKEKEADLPVLSNIAYKAYGKSRPVYTAQQQMQYPGQPPMGAQQYPPVQQQFQQSMPSEPGVQPPLQQPMPTERGVQQPYQQPPMPTEPGIQQPYQQSMPTTEPGVQQPPFTSTQVPPPVQESSATPSTNPNAAPHDQE